MPQESKLYAASSKYMSCHDATKNIGSASTVAVIKDHRGNNEDENDPAECQIATTATWSRLGQWVYGLPVNSRAAEGLDIGSPAGIVHCPYQGQIPVHDPGLLLCSSAAHFITVFGFWVRILLPLSPKSILFPRGH